MAKFEFEKLKDKDEVKLVVHHGYDRHVEVPETYQGYPVTMIDEEAFLYDEMESVKLPDTVTVIGNNAFSECEFLSYIKLPKHLKEIGDGAFADCDCLMISEFPDELEVIGSYAFGGCTCLEEIILPSSLKSIGDEAFSYCESLLNVFMSDQVYIGDHAFDEHTHVIVMSPENFELCRQDKAYNVKDDDPLYISVDGVLYNKDCTTLMKYPIRKKETTFVVPETVTTIAPMAFSDCTFPVQIVLHDGITSIGEQAFAFCLYLEEINLPSHLEKIEDYMFMNCSFLKNINIPETVTTIGREAFAGILELTSLTIPYNVQKIGEGAFDCCDYLTLNVYNDSYGLRYAQENGLSYQIIEEK